MSFEWPGPWGEYALIAAGALFSLAIPALMLLISKLIFVMSGRQSVASQQVAVPEKAPENRTRLNPGVSVALTLSAVFLVTAFFLYPYAVILGADTVGSGRIWALAGITSVIGVLSLMILYAIRMGDMDWSREEVQEMENLSDE